MPKPEERIPLEPVPDRATPPDDFDPYAPAPLPGGPLSDRALNEDASRKVCRGKYDGHRFGEDWLCEKCGMALEEFAKSDGVVRALLAGLNKEV